MTDLITMKEDILNNAKKKFINPRWYETPLDIDADKSTLRFHTLNIIDYQYITTSVLTITYLAGEVFTFKN